jgi:SAM-dependent methyltransferase
VLCHNVLEGLPDPGALVAEAVRVLRPGGRLVLAHSDFDTLVFASEDLALTRRLVRDYRDTRQPWMDAVDGSIGRRLADIAGQAGLQVEDVQAAVVLGRRFVLGEIGWPSSPARPSSSGCSRFIPGYPGEVQETI